MLPQAFLDRMKEQLGGEFDEYIASLDRPRAVALRFHPKKQVDLPFLQEKVEFILHKKITLYDVKLWFT